MGCYSEKSKEYRKKQRLRRKTTVQYERIHGKLRVILPKNINEIIEDRLVIDETAETGLKWTFSEHNQMLRRGKPAGFKTGGNMKNRRTPYFYYAVGITVDKTLYQIIAARIIWMLAYKDKPIDDKVIDHADGNPLNNKVSNLRLANNAENMTNCKCRAKSGYKNVVTSNNRFSWTMQINGKNIRSSAQKSKHKALLCGWDILTSGKIPLNLVKSQITEYLDGTYLQRALAECEKQGIAVTPPKFKTLHEYIAFVENNAN